MKWLNNWFSKQVRRVIDNERDQSHQTDGYEYVATIGSNKLQSSRGDLDCEPTLNFQMHRAETGWIMNVHNYDRRTERRNNTLHIINDSDDLGDSIAKIITIESMKAH
jgi:hypothetical protein